MTKPQIVFRADASLQIGTGHVVRCLTLAKALRASGAECTFLTRALVGHLCDRIQAEGFACELLPAPDGSADLPSDPPHAFWAGVPWQTDAAECATFLQGRTVDWLIMDHYAFDHRWQTVLRPHVSNIMVWDDLADRKHACDLLLDQNLGTSVQNYSALVPQSTRLLIGPKYAQLRSEFAAQRAEALVSRPNRKLKKILIAMGGVDQHNATGRLLDALALWPQAPSLDVSVVLGGKAPHLHALFDQAPTLPFPCEIATDVTDMGHRMAEADLAIGAVGGTTWERCALGLPTLMLTIAANQIPAATALHQTGSALLLGDETSNGWDEQLLSALDKLSDPVALATMSEIVAAVCDGDGTARLQRELVPTPVTLRPAHPEDARRVWEWRREGGASRFYRSQTEPAYPDHWAWFNKALRSQIRRFWVIEEGALPLGYVRLDLMGEDEALVSLCLAQDARGRGIGQIGLALIEQMSAKLGIGRLEAEIHPENLPSLRAFQKAGYVPAGENDGFGVFERIIQVKT